ncbi:hypothetical protein B0H14DRAFT_3602198 [Mycena olivaceomarginata]|nr:hypothetical protein B0H14DRAFT_3602198 [Mycena olivaceomarginata]
MFSLKFQASRSPSTDGISRPAHGGRPVYNVVPHSAEALIPLHPSGSLSNSPSLYQDSSRPRQHHGILKLFGLRSQTPAPLPAPAHWVVTSSSSTTPSGVTLQSDFTVLEIPSAFVPVLEDVKVDELAREVTTETAVAVKVDVPLGGCTSRNGGNRDSDRAGKRRRPKHKRRPYPRKFHLLPDSLPHLLRHRPHPSMPPLPASRLERARAEAGELTEVIVCPKTAGTIRPPRQDPPPPPPLPPVTLRPWRSSPNSKKATKEADAKVATLKTWRRPSPMKAKKMVEPEEEGELFKMFRDRKAGGRRLPLGVNSNVAGGSASTDPQAARKIRRIVVPQVVAGSVPSRNLKIVSELDQIRAQRKVQGRVGVRRSREKKTKKM